MLNFQALVVWLDGKKIIIAGCISVVVGYLATAGIINPNLATAILAILNILFGGIKLAGDQAIRNNTELGIALKSKERK